MALLSGLFFPFKKGFEISRAMKNMNDQDHLLGRKVTIEDHVAWETANHNPPQIRQRCISETALGATLRLVQQGANGLVDCRFPAARNGNIRSLQIVVCLIDDRQSSSLRDAQLHR